jgi:hypothetical protein
MWNMDIHHRVIVYAREHLHAKNICSFCDFEAESAESLIEHLPIHQPPYPFHCLYCDLKYKTRAQLNVHLPKHMNAKPFVCEIWRACLFIFFTSEKLCPQISH